MLNLQFNDRFNLLIGENVSMCTANSDILKKKMKVGAAGMKRLCLLALLLDHGADPNIKDSNGQTALSGLYINSEDRKKTAEILKKVTKQDMDTGV
ncbi:ankyrin repeat protein [Paenibacillus anaericanus]|nr:ankyrin repeat protein [Paenibacillus anaericanus]